LLIFSCLYDHLLVRMAPTIIVFQSVCTFMCSSVCCVKLDLPMCSACMLHHPHDCSLYQYEVTFYLTTFALKSALSDMTCLLSGFICLDSVHPLILSLVLSLPVSCFSCRQQMVKSFFFLTEPASLCV
jgi:hypothetical protein